MHDQEELVARPLAPTVSSQNRCGCAGSSLLCQGLLYLMVITKSTRVGHILLTNTDHYNSKVPGLPLQAMLSTKGQLLGVVKGATCPVSTIT